jgi:hypothetical protein
MLQILPEKLQAIKNKNMYLSYCAIERGKLLKMSFYIKPRRPARLDINLTLNNIQHLMAQSVIYTIFLLYICKA